VASVIQPRGESKPFSLPQRRRKSRYISGSVSLASYERLIDGCDSSCDSICVPVELTYPHIVKEPGKPARLERQPRTRVAMIVRDHQECGMSADEIVRQHPYLTRAEVHAALAYYFDHQESIEKFKRRTV
jgi:hypothetical protein